MHACNNSIRIQALEQRIEGLSEALRGVLPTDLP